MQKWLTPSVVLDPLVVKLADLREAAVDLLDLADLLDPAAVADLTVVDTRKDRDLFHTVAILSDDPHVALQVQFVGILLLVQILFQTLFAKNADLGDIPDIRLQAI